MTAGRIAAALTARFDDEALRPPALAPAADVERWAGQPAWAALARLCAPQGGPPLAVATLAGPEALACGEAFAAVLDGSQRLAALGRAAGLAWRLQVKLRDALPWRGLQPGDPWDSGWARTAPASLRHLPIGFAPRRATLVLADVADRPALTLALATFVQKAEGWRHPLRWLWLDGRDEGALRVLPG